MIDLLLILAGTLAGGMNALAGGGSFVSLPALIAAGAPSISANATSTFALFPGSLASCWVYRSGLGDVCGVPLRPIAVATFFGGLVGSLLLLATPSSMFEAILPWLLLIATIMLVTGGRIGPALRKRFRVSLLAVVTLQFILGIYGGYFGGAVGLMMMAAWSVLDGAEIKALNAPRTLMVASANGIALVVFIIAGAITWRACLPLLFGALVGGWIGAHAGRLLPPSVIRLGTIGLAVLTTVVFFMRALR
ncbi:membrane protein [Rhizobium yanglingense]|nr:membrane protein [Rhizobium yanglingense]